jgi:hypothetical protein
VNNLPIPNRAIEFLNKNLSGVAGVTGREPRIIIHSRDSAIDKKITLYFKDAILQRRIVPDNGELVFYPLYEYILIPLNDNGPYALLSGSIKLSAIEHNEIDLDRYSKYNMCAFAMIQQSELIDDVGKDLVKKMANNKNKEEIDI